MCIIGNNQDSNEFWGLWQIDVEDAYIERSIRPLPAPFVLSEENFKYVAEGLFSSDILQCEAQCILLVLRLGAASHDVSFSNSP